MLTTKFHTHTKQQAKLYFLDALRSYRVSYQRTVPTPTRVGFGRPTERDSISSTGMVFSLHQRIRNDSVALLLKGYQRYFVRCTVTQFRRRWEANIKMDLLEVGRGDMDWTDQTQDRDRWPALVIAVMNLRVP